MIFDSIKLNILHDKPQGIYFKNVEIEPCDIDDKVNLVEYIKQLKLTNSLITWIETYGKKATLKQLTDKMTSLMETR